LSYAAGIAQTEFHCLVFREFPWSFELNFDLNVYTAKGGDTMNAIKVLVVALTILGFSTVSFAQATPATPAKPATPPATEKKSEKAMEKSAEKPDDTKAKAKAKGKTKKSTKKATDNTDEKKSDSMDKKTK
jgi:hypothetical protein